MGSESYMEKKEISLEEIDQRLDALVTAIDSLQNPDGGFDTMFLQSHYHPNEGWMKFGSSTFDAALVAIVLNNLQSDTARSVVAKVVPFIAQNSFLGKLWAYASLNEMYPHYFDTDSTALCSFVIEQNGGEVLNKEIISQMSDGKGYSVFVGLKGIIPTESILFHCKLFLHNMKVKRGLAYKNNLMRLSDTDFVVTCNNLLYLGEGNWDAGVLEQIKKAFISGNLQRMYYPSRASAVHAFSRLCFFRGLELDIDRTKLNRLLKWWFDEIDPNGATAKYETLLLGTSMLYLGLDISQFENEIESCARVALREELVEMGVYSGNLKTDLQPDGKTPNSYFGSKAITGAAYVEFLNFYRYRRYGSFYT